jgi:hypothetical protein
LAKLTFQVIRRTIATLSQTKGGIKATQGMLRHDRLPTTGNVYVQMIPEEVEGMVNSVNSELRKPSTAAAETTAMASSLRARKERGSKRNNTKLAPNHPDTLGEYQRSTS